MTSEIESIEQQYRLEARQWLKDNIDPIEEKQPFSTLHWMPSQEREDQQGVRPASDKRRNLGTQKKHCYDQSIDDETRQDHG